MDVRGYEQRLSRQHQLLTVKFQESAIFNHSAQLGQAFAAAGAFLALLGFLVGAHVSVFVPALAGLLVTAVCRSLVNRQSEMLEIKRLKLERVKAKLENHATIMHDLLAARKTFDASHARVAASRKKRSKPAPAPLSVSVLALQPSAPEAIVSHRQDLSTARPRKSKSVRRMKRSQVADILDGIHKGPSDFGNGLPA